MPYITLNEATSDKSRKVCCCCVFISGTFENVRSYYNSFCVSLTACVGTQVTKTVQLNIFYKISPRIVLLQRSRRNDNFKPTSHKELNGKHS